LVGVVEMAYQKLEEPVYMDSYEAMTKYPDKFILVRNEPDDTDNYPKLMCTVFGIGDDYKELQKVGQNMGFFTQVILGEYYDNVPGLLVPPSGCYWKINREETVN